MFIRISSAFQNQNDHLTIFSDVIFAESSIWRKPSLIQTVFCFIIADLFHWLGEIEIKLFEMELKAWWSEGSIFVAEVHIIECIWSAVRALYMMQQAFFVFFTWVGIPPCCAWIRVWTTSSSTGNPFDSN